MKFDDDIKVLMYGDIPKLRSTMNHHFINQLEMVADEITQNPNTLKSLNKYIHEGEFTHVIIPDEWFHKLNGTLKNCEVPVIELLGDHWVPWAIDKKKKYIQENGIQHLIMFSDRFQEPYKKLSDISCVLTGYDSSVFYNRDTKRDIDILIHGSLGEDTHKWVYPVRNWLSEVLPEIGAKEGLKVEKWEHPGYWPGEKPAEHFTELYSKILNRSKIAIGGSSHWRLPLKKFYEVTACGSILLSDLPLEDRDFFENRIIEVDGKRINSRKYEDKLREKVVDVFMNYEKSKENLQPFRTKQDYFNKSYHGKALEIRAVLSGI